MIAKPKRKPNAGSSDFAKRYDGTVACAWCESVNTKLSNPFGGTVSEMLFTCSDCGETFGWMKWQMLRDSNEKIKA